MVSGIFKFNPDRILPLLVHQLKRNVIVGSGMHGHVFDLMVMYQGYVHDKAFYMEGIAAYRLLLSDMIDEINELQDQIANEPDLDEQKLLFVRLVQLTQELGIHLNGKE